jgi:hypothetical protein
MNQLTLIDYPQTQPPVKAPRTARIETPGSPEKPLSKNEQMKRLREDLAYHQMYTRISLRDYQLSCAAVKRIAEKMRKLQGETK